MNSAVSRSITPSSKTSVLRNRDKVDAAPFTVGRQSWRFLLAIIAITLLAYLPAFRAGYVWDDNDHVTQTSIQRTTTVLKWVWLRLGTTPQYYPLTHTTFWLE